MAKRGGTIINISGLTPVEDPSYRYKMPVVFGKIEGKGNGIKTVIPNITEVANSLHRAPGEVTKYFGCELGAQTTYNQEKDRAIVNGAHTDLVLQQLIHKYIDSFVLCPNCGLPETDYKIKNGLIMHMCAACGAKEMVDMSHKLTNYIIAHKPKKKASTKEDKNAKEGKKGKKEKKEKKEKSGSDEEKKKKDKKKKESKKDKKKKDKKESSSSNHLEDAVFVKKEKSFSDSDEESVDSEAGVDDAGALIAAVEGTQAFLKENPKAKHAEVAEVVVNQQMSSALKTHDRLQIFLRAVITPSFYKEKQIEANAPIIREITKGNPVMERHLIGAIESMWSDNPKNFTVMLKQLYDEDALDEEVILEWAFDGRSEYTSVDEDARATLRAEAEPVVNWLQEESDSDSDDD